MSDYKALDRVLEARFSCRGYMAERVDRKIVSQIVETAQKVPSWCNSQPWHLTICEGETRDALETALAASVAAGHFKPDIEFPERYQGVYKERRSVCGWQLYDAVGVQKGDREGSAAQMRRNFAFFGAPQVAIVTTPAELGAYGVLDCGAFVTGFCLVAQSLGVATIPQAAIAGHAEVVREVLGLPEDRHVLCAISFGYADPDHPANGFRTGRAELHEIVDWRD